MLWSLWSLIFSRAEYGSNTTKLECVVQLVQMGCEVNMVTSRFNQTPTHTAAFGGHPHCVVWLTQAGADINMQDYVGEAPIHKAAQSGSLECVQVLLLAGAKPHLRNARGQTAADLAHAHGFHDCFCFISNAQKQLQQFGGVHLKKVQNGDSIPNSQNAFSRKRQLAAEDTSHMKKIRKDNGVLVQMQVSAGEEVESMNLELSSDENTNRLRHTLLSVSKDHFDLPKSIFSPSSPLPASQGSPQTSTEMCGSLHLTGSPSSCVSQRLGGWGLMESEYGDFLHYGHYHGFGDTAEELGSHIVDSSSLIQTEQKHRENMATTIHHYNGS
ncbi:ankyrin repeat domain-containing protein 10-like isoform 2-T2 [Pholidichthys leucotaenia]